MDQEVNMAAAASGSSRPNVDELDNLTCSVCLEIFEKPTRIKCGHTFCWSCLKDLTDIPEPQCPLCRKKFNPTSWQKDQHIEKQINQTRSHCKGCNKRMSLAKLRHHNIHCSKLAPDLTFKPVAETSQPIPSDLPNRSTFKCPFCGLRNLDNQSLIKHCNDQHRDSPAQVVCPICASMPWGDPTLKSANFLSHLNLRHHFEYETFVDYEQDDDAMLQAALQASLEMDK